MTHKSSKVAATVAKFSGRRLDARYLGYFDCFNRQLFYEAHEILEDLWLPQRRGPDGDYHKGLIQLAGAFVHLQKNRLRPADALFRLAVQNLSRYPAHHAATDVAALLKVIAFWQHSLESDEYRMNPLHRHPPPCLPMPE
jgi:predicted metal-dependent hydrolase